MNPERWRQIDKICIDALDRTPAERPSFLDAACANDPSLRQEVEALLGSVDHAERFLESPAVDALDGGRESQPGGFANKTLPVYLPTMRLTSGRRLGPYEIQSAIGAGGMGEVYRARDPRLGRDVAVKILPTAFVADRDRVARFQREAQVLASLNHPNIAIIHDVQESGGVHALVLELVEGPTLADRIAQGPIPLEDALPIARQIAEALEAAHEQSIIHRDLKPANVKLRSDGVVKVLDFGLAKALMPEPGSAAASLSPTLSSPATTQGGVILGTAAYMSPEQARGKPVDKRADIWAFGCVLYEMLTGARAFAREEVTDVMAAILRADPELEKLPVQTPAAIRRLLQRCLEKDRKERLPDIAMARLEIKDAQKAPAATDGVAAAPVQQARRPRAFKWIATAGIGLVLGAAAVFLLWSPWRMRLSAPVYLSAELGADVSLATDGGSAALLSPDGSLLVFIARKNTDGPPQLYVRRLDEMEALPLSGTENARDAFFSPDGEWIAFFAGGKLKKISVTGGAAVTICNVGDDRGGWWAEDDTIVFQPTIAGSGLLRVGSGGTSNPEPLTTLAAGEVTQRFPQVLPGGKAVLYTSSNNTGSFDEASLVVQPLPSGPRKVLQTGGYYGAGTCPQDISSIFTKRRCMPRRWISTLSR